MRALLQRHAPLTSWQNNGSKKTGQSPRKLLERSREAGALQSSRICYDGRGISPGISRQSSASSANRKRTTAYESRLSTRLSESDGRRRARLISAARSLSRCTHLHIHL